MPYNDSRRDDDFGETFDDFEQGPAPPRSSSSGNKVLLIILSIAGVTLLLCCGSGVAFFFWARHAADDFGVEFVEEPEAARSLTAEIAEIDIPDQFEPAGATRMNLVFMSMKMAMFRLTDDEEDDEPPMPPGKKGGMLMVAEMEYPGVTVKEQQAEFKNQMQQQGYVDENLIVTESETREFEIRGEKVKFRFNKCKNPDTDETYRVVSGGFSGKKGVALLMLQVPEEDYDEPAVVRMIESIK